jgi:hypothetical protein
LLEADILDAEQLKSRKFPGQRAERVFLSRIILCGNELATVNRRLDRRLPNGHDQRPYRRSQRIEDPKAADPGQAIPGVKAFLQLDEPPETPPVFRPLARGSSPGLEVDLPGAGRVGRCHH